MSNARNSSANTSTISPRTSHAPSKPSAKSTCFCERSGKIVNNDPDLRINRSLDLLASLKKTAAEFAKKEEQLFRDFRTRRYAATRKHHEAMEKLETEFAAQIGETESHFARENERVEAIYEGRRNWIRRAHNFAIRNLPRRARDAKEKWIGELQMRHFLAERSRTAAFANADVEYAEFTAKLVEQRKTLASLSRRTREFFRGYWTFTRMLSVKKNALETSVSSTRDPNELFAN